MASQGFDTTEKQDPSLFTVHEGLSVSLVPAPLLKRALALAVDWGIVSTAVQLLIIPVIMILVVAGVISAVFIEKLKSGFLGSSALVMGIIAIVAVLLFSLFITHGYFIWYEMKKAQTIGKKLFGLKVISLDGGNLTFQQCALREFFRYIDAFLLLPGLISVLVTEKRQRIGDLASGTMVTYSAKSEARDENMYMKSEELELVARDWPIGSLQPNDNFLAFANRVFILGEWTERTPQELDFWFQHLQGSLADPKPVIADRNRFLRYMAEQCFQRKRGL